MTKILLVEDDKSLREIYGVRLLAEGYDIVSAGDGEEALAMAIKERPQMIISDVMMPKISGFDMLDILRSTTETKDIKVIMMTALSSEDQRARGQALGADRYLVKSQVGIEDVVRTVHEVLKDAPVAGTSAAQAFGGPASSAAPSPRPMASSVPSHPTPPPVPQFNTTPVASPAPTAEPSLPQPTAPFSTSRPSGLGERVIHPISTPPSPSSAPSADDLASRMSQELQNAAPAAAPTPPPAPAMPTPPTPTPPEPPVTTPPITPPQPTSSPAPQPVVPEERGSGIQFEEIPRPPAPPSPTA
jgi:CheY-like chemotaxis protein